MKTISFQAFTDAGCMVIFDPGSGFQVTEEWLHSMNHVTDPDGRTCVTADYPQGTWPAVWMQHVTRLRELGRKGEFTFLLCDEIEYACRVSDGISEEEALRLKRSFEEWAYTPTGWLVIGDAMAAFSGASMNDDPFVKIKVAPGWNKVTVHHLEEPDALPHTLGFEGSKEHPAIVFIVSFNSSEPPDIDVSRPASRINAPQKPAPGLFCEATVSAVDVEIVKFRLRESNSVHSGYGRMSKPESIRFHPGDEVRVRLVEDKKAFWIVELA
jgi:hypothetical protein